MSLLLINYHTFYEKTSELGKAFKGPTPDQVRHQMRAIKQQVRPATSLWEALASSEPTFLITMDDGSKSVLDALPVFKDEGVHVICCVCGAPTLEREVLQAHKVNLMRTRLDDSDLWSQLCSSFNTDFNIEKWPLPKEIVASSLYRYDQPTTRRLKMALNYQLAYDQAKVFLDAVFRNLFGDEKGMCKELYLSLADLEQLQNQMEIMYHGLCHRLWSSLNQQAHKEEITPPAELLPLLSERYLLSIPFGMTGTYDSSQILKDAGRAAGAFTMARTMAHEQTEGFWWLHRFDQADIFTPDGRVCLPIKK